LGDIYKITRGEGSSQVRTLAPKFTIVALERWAEVHRNRQNMEFLI